MSYTSYNIEGTTITYGPSLSGGYARAYTGGNIGSAIEVRGDQVDPITNYKIDAQFSTDIEYVTFKITDFDFDEEATVYVFDENNNQYDLTTVGVVSVGSFITQTGNTFNTTSSSINIDGNNNAEDIYGSVLFYFPGKVSRIDIAGVLTEDGSLRISEYNYCLNDYDNDGVKDFLDLDSDNDGIPDIVEAGGIDNNNDGIADSIIDNNNNGIPDAYDPNCIGTTSGNGNADSVVNTNLVTSQSNILGPQDSAEAIIAPSGSITVDLTDSVIPNSLIIVKHRRASGVSGVPFTVEQSSNPMSGFSNLNSYSTNDSGTPFSASYRVQSVNARYIRITNTDNDQNLGIDFLSYSFGSLTDCSGTIGSSISLLNSDSDANENWIDLDSDNDGIPDNIEAQPTNMYQAPSGAINSSTGIYTIYNGLEPEDTDSDGVPDYLDVNSDNDLTPDIEENGMANSLSNSDQDNDGLDDNFEGSNLNDFDVNDEIDNPSSSILPDSDSNLGTGGDLDYRDYDCSAGLDSDNDGISDVCDVDDDNDGILDIDECVPVDSGLTGPLLGYTTDITSSDPMIDSVPHHLNSITYNGVTYNDFIIPSSFEGNFTVDNTWGVRYTVLGEYQFSLQDNAANFNIDVLSGFQSRDLGAHISLSNNDFSDGDYFDLKYDDVITSTDGGFIAITERGGNNPTILQALDINYNPIGSAITIATGDYQDTGHLIWGDSNQNAVMALYPVDDLAPVGSLIRGVRVSGGPTATNDGPDNKVFFFGNLSSIIFDTDTDGQSNCVDLDSDNDGIPDNIEAQTTTGYITPSGVINTTGSYVGLWDNYGTGITPINSDTDANEDYLDIDTDNDGIPDNIEAQPTSSYIAPSVITSTTFPSIGLWDNYGIGFTTPEDTDGDDVQDYRDTDTDNDGTPDIQENGDADTLSNTDTDADGLDDSFDVIAVNWDPNDEVTTGDSANLIASFGDSDNDLILGGDLDYRDLFDINPPASATIDFDGVDDYVIGTPVLSAFNQSNTDGVTIMGWIKSDSDAGDTATKFVFGERESVELFITDEDIRAYIHIVSSTGANQTHDVYRTTTGIERGIWRHVAITIDFANNNAQLILDGRSVFGTNLFDAVKFQSEDTAANENFRMGNDPSLNSTRFFKGAIDEIRIFDKLIGEEELRNIIFQEIENASGSVKGSIVNNTISSAAWSDLQLYYPMTNITGGKIIDESLNDNKATLYNITTLQEQTAPMPYITKQDGNWHDKNTWLHGDIWFIPGDEVVEAATYGSDEVVYWGIYHIKNNLTLTTAMSEPNKSRAIKGIEALGLIIDEEDSSNNPITFTIGDGTEDLQVNVTNYFELNGTLDLIRDSQLIQGENSDLVTSASGKILRRQEGNADSYWYNYWSSPVGSVGVTTLSNNNSSGNNTNNTPFSLSMLKDGTGTPMQFTSNFEETGMISNRWLYSFQNGITYWDWITLTSASNISPGVGYTQKGTGVATTDQQYIFEGKPNNGTILIAADDVDGDSANESQQDVTLTTTLIGNPYPSALDVEEFIRDNIDFDNGSANPIIQGTILLWEQWAGSSHWLSEYEGGYGYINLTGTARAYQHPDIPLADQVQASGIKTPTKFLPVGQGFFVEVINDGDIEFNNGQRTFKNENAGESVFFRNSQDTEETSEEEESNNMQLIKLEFGTSNGATRRFVLGFSENTTDDFDFGYDGGLITQPSDEDMTSLQQDRMLAIQAFSPITEDKVINLAFNGSGNHTYILDIAEVKNIDENQDVFIKDNRQDVYWNLTQDGAYHFSSEAGQFNDRFDIVFKAEETLGTDDFDTSNVLIYNNNLEQKLYIKGLNQAAKSLTLINVIGQTVKSFTDVSNNTMENGINIQNLSSGIYIVNIKTEDDNKLSKKIILE